MMFPYTVTWWLSWATCHSSNMEISYQYIRSLLDYCVAKWQLMKTWCCVAEKCCITVNEYNFVTLYDDAIDWRPTETHRYLKEGTWAHTHTYTFEQPISKMFVVFPVKLFTHLTGFFTQLRSSCQRSEQEPFMSDLLLLEEEGRQWKRLAGHTRMTILKRAAHCQVLHVAPSYASALPTDKQPFMRCDFPSLCNPDCHFHSLIYTNTEKNRTQKQEREIASTFWILISQQCLCSKQNARLSWDHISIY